eukprot:TRINITY_DN15590_c0_g1_i1.p2 TRINITY_DN15590_c0_g1~~TRINITY_DN15590_c0_g1_i1.p2  ORF type:complete len:64 (-),score=10.29 TRINITY_DN15590_c0_g1_i1:319-510(-)
MLSKFGEIKKFWMNDIKTHCFTTFDSTSGAEKCRNALYMRKWTQRSTPRIKRLMVDFITDHRS